MARCPHLKVEDTGAFSWRYHCDLSHACIGDENHREQVNLLCDTDRGYTYEQCPVWQKINRGYVTGPVPEENIAARPEKEPEARPEREKAAPEPPPRRPVSDYAIPPSGGYSGGSGADTNLGGSIGGVFLIAIAVFAVIGLNALITTLSNNFDAIYSRYRMIVGIGLPPVAALLYWLVSSVRGGYPAAEARARRRFFFLSFAAAMVLELMLQYYMSLAYDNAEDKTLFILYVCIFGARLIFSFLEAFALRRIKREGASYVLVDKTISMHIVSNVLYIVLPLLTELLGGIGNTDSLVVVIGEVILLGIINAVLLALTNLPFYVAKRH